MQRTLALAGGILWFILKDRRAEADGIFQFMQKCVKNHNYGDFLSLFIYLFDLVSWLLFYDLSKIGVQFAWHFTGNTK